VTDYGNWQKYQNPNPIQRALLARFLRRLAGVFGPLRPATVLDVGCGEGFVAAALQAQATGAPTRFVGLDRDVDALQRAGDVAPALLRCQADAGALPFADDAFELGVCTEVLEHLSDPTRALVELLRVCRTGALLSVPHEPGFRLANFVRGKHVRRWGNDPEHVNHWSAQGFRRFLEPHGRVISLASSFPWLLAYVRGRRAP
jgi:SAM-dependent methyltransferase